MQTFFDKLLAQIIQKKILFIHSFLKDKTKNDTFQKATETLLFFNARYIFLNIIKYKK